MTPTTDPPEPSPPLHRDRQIPIPPPESAKERLVHIVVGKARAWCAGDGAVGEGCDAVAYEYGAACGVDWSGDGGSAFEGHGGGEGGGWGGW